MCSLSPQIAQDKLTQIANKNWSTAARAREPPPAFRPELVTEVYSQELGGGSDKPPKLKRIMLLEISQVPPERRGCAGAAVEKTSRGV